MLADYCQKLRRDVPQAKYSRKLSSLTFQVMYILSVIQCKYRCFSHVNGASLKTLA
jgi:hypothetical protein